MFVKGKESKFVLKQNWLHQNGIEENKVQNGRASWGTTERGKKNFIFYNQAN